MILGISGGLTGGNCDFLLEEALKECKKDGFETSLLNIRDLDISPCDDCGTCKTADCKIKDDMYKIYPLLKEADGIILASPVYFGSVCAHLSILMERSLPHRRHGFELRNKVGGAIAVGGSRNGGQEMTIKRIHDWMLIHDMVIVGDTMPTSHFGGIAVGRNKGDVKDDEAGLKTVRNLGKKVAQITKKLK